MTGALSHIRVLDLSRVLAGPWATQVLGDLGADIIKVERPGTGDETRGWGPPYVRDPGGAETADAAYFMCANRNKRSVAIDFTRPEGQALLLRLAARCDVVVENFKVGGLRQYGLDDASLRAANPRLIYCSITGFGQTGPYASRAGYDFLIQGLGGLMSLTGAARWRARRRAIEGGRGGDRPAHRALCVQRHPGRGSPTGPRRGRGSTIDLALLDVQVACLANQAMNYLIGGAEPRRDGQRAPEHRAVSGLPHGGRRHDPGRGQ